MLRLIDIRQGSAADLAQVDAIMQRAFDPRYGEAWTRAQCLGIMAMPGVWLTLATVDGAATGFALARAHQDEAELLLLATAPERRRMGVGRALLHAVINDARARGVKTVFLEVRANNEAITLYLGNGFTKAGERRGYYRGRNGELFDAYTFCHAIG
ncbi:MAG: GNAT family N-acetyltransferase [Sphingomonas sp.]|uniref:GNAT family N-acetyltransferase n=1 Tax=Sphingomonas sp. TaxID=28214 RepID=UPI000DB0E7A1|nr:ribosomal-protein-alanine acetyltransferase [Zymomonas sp.]MBA4771776.1 GNAT family N-acetyltransferase [Sphingomonas sp.]PZP18854.1 MAG: ribosomal-protein-alanine acetyltransferase [Sphingomonas hengshuiensis]